MKRLTITRLLLCYLSIITYTLSARADTTEYAKKSIWHSTDLQFYIVIEDNLYERYQYTRISCFRGSAGFLPSIGYFNEDYFDNNFKLESRKDGYHITRPQDAIAIPIQQIKRLPSYCKGEPVNTILNNFYIFWHTLNELYSFSHISQDQWIDKLKEMLNDIVLIDIEVMEDRTSEDLLLLEKLQSLIDIVNDPHLFLVANKQKKVLRANDETFIFPSDYETIAGKNEFLKKQAASLDNKVVSFANDRIHFARHSNQVYLGFSSFDSLHPSGRYIDESEKIIQDTATELGDLIKANDNVVVDLRVNEGGSVNYANLFASLFSTEEKTTSSYLVKSPDTITREIPLSILSGSGIEVNSVTVLISRLTASAAEYMTLNLQSLNAVTVGDRTRGAFSPLTLKALPNGWVFGLPAFQIKDDKQQWVPERVGINADKVINWKYDDSFQLLDLRGVDAKLFNLSPDESQ
ncbi:MAG: S41 family peptidase [Gammaproteobacteria bacterium]